MTHVALSASLALFLVPLTMLADGGKDKAKPGVLDEQFLALRKEYQVAIKDVDDDKKHKIAVAFAPRFFALAGKNARDEGAADALLWILINAPKSAEMPKAAKLLENGHVQSPRLKLKMKALHSSDTPEVERFLRTIMEKNSDTETQGLACLSLAQMLKDRAGDDNKKLRKDAMDLLDVCVTKYADCPFGDKATIGGRARPLLFEMRNLAIGKVVPDIIGEDLQGQKLKITARRRPQPLDQRHVHAPGRRRLAAWPGHRQHRCPRRRSTQSAHHAVRFGGHGIPSHRNPARCAMDQSARPPGANRDARRPAHRGVVLTTSPSVADARDQGPAS
jgi:hypothetical protein